MKIFVLALGAVSSLAAAGFRLAGPSPLATPAIKLLTLSPQAGRELRLADTLRATLRYTLPQADTARYGYTMFIQFATTSPYGSTMSVGESPAEPTLTPGTGTISIVTPLAPVWNNSLIRHPLTCYYYLAKRTGPGRSTVVARTGPFTFKE